MRVRDAGVAGGVGGEAVDGFVESEVEPYSRPISVVLLPVGDDRVLLSFGRFREGYFVLARHAARFALNSSNVTTPSPRRIARTRSSSVSPSCCAV